MSGQLLRRARLGDNLRFWRWCVCRCLCDNVEVVLDGISKEFDC
jgi:hypothetical protein